MNSFKHTDSDLSTVSTITDDASDSPRGPLGLQALSTPSEPLADFVFVHGLGGGSRKTWSKTKAATHYWPQAWLPKDSTFKEVQIHSFGYDSDWTKGGDKVLNIHHFGKALLGELSTSPLLRSGSGPIVFLGHSMGGLVIKKCVMLARQGRDAMLQGLAKRFHTIIFLATPHRGSDSAHLLNNILNFAYSSRTYVSDLLRDSGTIQSINDEFRQHAASISLWSFYETQKLSLKIFKTLIVDPESATLGYPGEKQMPMNADHRSICKFESVLDPNYLTLRNALGSIVASITQSSGRAGDSLRIVKLQSLTRYLDVGETLEDDLINAEDARMVGTCEWLAKKPKYQSWKDFRSPAPRLLWVNGKPATGKSILAGYVFDDLKTAGAHCSCFFFRYDDKSKSRLSSCLRSLAFQMAQASENTLNRLLELEQLNVKFDRDNENVIWRKILLPCILEEGFDEHYWIIDAVDECADCIALFDKVLAKIDSSVPLRVFITSRKTIELENHFRDLGPHSAQVESITETDTLPDIKRFVQARALLLKARDDATRISLVDKIVAKSQGSFLWTSLVVKELERSHGEDETKQVLGDIPRGMEPFYQRTLDIMSKTVRGKKLAKAILTWTTCATRPLSIAELEEALRIDVKDDFPKLGESIIALCGQLVTIDKFAKVHMVHETARQFLLTKGLTSEFAIDKDAAHAQIACVCLRYLCGEEMRPPRITPRYDASNLTKKNDFSQYSSAAFSYHLARTNFSASDVLRLTETFLKSNVLSWIEVIAETRNLIPLVRTARDLRTYYDTCAEMKSSLSNELRIIRAWTTDLIRIAAKFADALITTPSSIHGLILPFCPSESQVYKTTSLTKKLTVMGLSHAQWDDRLACIDFNQVQTGAVQYGKDFLAVGLSNGAVALYHATSCQEYKILMHGEAVRFLQFRGDTGLLATCGRKLIKVWDSHSGEMIQKFTAPHRPFGLAFVSDKLIVALDKNYLATWDLDRDGMSLSNRLWRDIDETRDLPLRMTPCALSISIGHRMMAVAYSQQAITIWDIDNDMYYGSCGKRLPSGETSHRVTALVFNPNPNVPRIAVGHLDGELAILDPFGDQEVASFRANCNTLAASPDGRLLVGGAARGVVEIYEFDTLRLLYRVKSSNLGIRQLAFNRDGTYVADVRGSQCNVWEPTLLHGSSSDDDNNNTDSASLAIEVITPDTKVQITAMALHADRQTVFCGKADGHVSAYDTRTGAQVRLLYRHRTLVRLMSYWHERDSIVSIDLSNSIIILALEWSPRDGWKSKDQRLHFRLDSGSSVIQVLPSIANAKLLLITRESDHLWTADGEEENARAYSEKPGIRKWIQHPQSPQHIICFDGATAQMYSWDDWSKVASLVLTTSLAGLQHKSITPYFLKSRWHMLLELCERDGSSDTRGLYLIDVAAFNIRSELGCEACLETTEIDDKIPTLASVEKAMQTAVCVPLLGPYMNPLSDTVAHIIGIGRLGRLVFRDTRSWVCSANLEDLGTGPVSYSRHFFVPHDWFSGTREVVCAAANRDIFFARNDDLAVIKGGLDFVASVQEVEKHGESEVHMRLSPRTATLASKNITLPG